MSCYLTDTTKIGEIAAYAHHTGLMPYGITTQQIDLTTAERIAEVLATANLKSIWARYDRRHDVDFGIDDDGKAYIKQCRIEAKKMATRTEAMKTDAFSINNMRNLVGEYEYQACEPTDWYTEIPLAHRVLIQVKAHLLDRALHAYQYVDTALIQRLVDQPIRLF